MQDLNWNDLRYVLAVARARSLASAARRLGVNETTVGRRIAEAERRLGTRIFERSRGGLRTSGAGIAVIAGAERVEREVQAVEAAVSGADQRAAGLVRVTSVPILINRVLVPALPALLGPYPDLRIELIAEPQNLSLTRREADVALRLARPQQELRTVARRVGQLDYAVYGPTADPAEPAPASLPWITYEDAMSDLPQWGWIAAQSASVTAGGTTVRTTGREETPPLAVNDAETILQAVKTGLGKSLLPVAVAGREPGLARLGDGPPALSREIWLLVHPELRDLIRIRVVMDWLCRTAGCLTEG